MASSLTAYGLAGELDPSFVSQMYGVGNGTVSTMEKQPDGKILIGGTFTTVNGTVTTAVARLNADGSLDATFSSPEFGNGTGVGGAVLAIGVQSNGKIVVGGDIYGVNGVFTKKLYRLNPDGSLDNTFQAPSFTSGQGIVYDIEIQTDDKIVFGGDFITSTGGATQNFARLNADGTVDGTFAGFSTAGTIWSLEIQPDGKIITGGTSLITRRTADGSSDSTFTNVSGGTAFALQMLPDGSFLAGGQFSSLNGFQKPGIAKINSDGSLDLTFNLNGQGANWIEDIALAADGKILIAGTFSTYNGVARQKVARLNADGTLDTTFQNNPSFTNLNGKDVEIFADGKVLFGGGIQVSGLPSMLRLNIDGSPDTSVSYTVSLAGKVREIVPLPDGKMLVAGQFTAVNGVKRNSLARLNADGTVDPTFVPYFNNDVSSIFNALAVQADGKILVGGFTTPILRRLNADGTQDTSFSPGIGTTFNSVIDIQVLPNGQILLGGDMFTTGSSVRKLVRLNANGALDTTFAVNQPNGTVYGIEVQTDGKIVIGGDFTQIGSDIRGRVARLNADGTVDPTFNPPGGANGSVYNVKIQTDGKILVGGNFTGLNGNLNRSRIGRLNADGTLDTAFAQTLDGFVVGMKLQTDGKILVGGNFASVGGTSRVGLARLNPNGSLDTSLNVSAPGGVVDIQLQTDGKILIGGDFVRINGVPKLRLARLLNTTAPPKRFFDYDGDGKSDISVFRPSENKWYILRSSDASVYQPIFAIAGDIPTPADYDGDGKTDVAIFRPGTGDWWYLSSINNAQISVNWGQSGDIPMPSDIDGDGKTDFVFFRPSNNTWYRLSSTGVQSQIVFGTTGDKPLIGDFDGDGKSDPAIFRPSSGDWWYRSSISGQFITVHWGANGDYAVPGDYDADGKTDFVVFRPTDGGWYILYSTGSYTIATFGTVGDKPVAADYDGDGKTDIAVFRPSTGVWYLLQTTAGFGAVNWGISTDVPTEFSFLQ